MNDDGVRDIIASDYAALVSRHKGCVKNNTENKNIVTLAKKIGKKEK